MAHKAPTIIALVFFMLLLVVISLQLSSSTNPTWLNVVLHTATGTVPIDPTVGWGVRNGEQTQGMVHGDHATDVSLETPIAAASQKTPAPPTTGGSVLQANVLGPGLVVGFLLLMWAMARQQSPHLHMACFTVAQGRAPRSILVIGGDTEVGRQLIHALVSQGHETTVRVFGSGSTLDLQPLPSPAHLTAYDELQSACAGADAIVWCGQRNLREKPHDASPSMDDLVKSLQLQATMTEQPVKLILYAEGELPTVPELPPSVHCSMLYSKDFAGGLDATAVSEALLDVLLGRPLAEGSPVREFQGLKGSSVSRWLRLAVLLTVPLAWGTYAPAVRYMYTLPHPVPSLIFATMYHAFAMASLAIPVLLGLCRQKSDVPFRQVIKAGAELGGYKFLGNCALLFALRLTTSGVASFIVQLSTVIVPMLEAFVLHTPVPGMTWLACGLSLGGVAVFAGDGLMSGKEAMGIAAVQGDLLAALAAVLYSLQILRLGKWAPCTKATSLAICKVFFELIYNLTLIGVLLIFRNPLGQDMTQFVKFATAGNISWEAWKGILGAAGWVGGISCAYTMWAQSFGQRTVRPVNANLIYASQPIFSAIIGVSLLGESFGRFGFLGAMLIGSGVAISIMAQRRELDRKSAVPNPTLQGMQVA